jgi:hypothetical protein
MHTYSVLDTPIHTIEIVDPIQTLVELIRSTYHRGKTSGYLAFFATRHLLATDVGLHYTRHSGLQIEVDLEEVLASLPKLSSADIDEATSCVEMDRSRGPNKERK